DCCFSFFFQAEDGIRDLYVTGVQTCALPIFHVQPHGVPVGTREFRVDIHEGLHPVVAGGDVLQAARGKAERARVDDGCLAGRERSEERRVGKEWRCGWWGAAWEDECGQ